MSSANIENDSSYTTRTIFALFINSPVYKVLFVSNCDHSTSIMQCQQLLKMMPLIPLGHHIGIQGNEMVDKQAKTLLSLEPTSFKILFSSFKPSINKYILEEWQTSWNNSIGNKVLDSKPTIGEYQSVVRNIRKEEVVLARLRLGHTRVTHSYLLQGEE